MSFLSEQNAISVGIGGAIGIGSGGSSFPNLSIDFTTGVLDSRITFTRATSASNPATYVNSSGYIVSATNNQPRFDYSPTALTISGLLIEGSRTNLMSSSVSFSGWSAVNSTPTGSSGTSPDNMNAATKLVPNTTSAQHRLDLNFSATNTVTYTLSVFAKAGEALYDGLQLRGVNCDAQFDLSSGIITIISSGSATIRNFGNGWYRCTVTGTATSTATATNRINVYYNGSQVYPGDGTSGIYIWGVQHEVSAFATSLIPTTSGPLTRNADVAVMSGTDFSNWFNSVEGSAVVQARLLVPYGTRTLIRFDDTTSSNFIGLQAVETDAGLQVTSNGVSQAALDAGTISANTAFKLGGAWKAADFATVLNGGTVVKQASGTVPAVTQAMFRGDGTNYLNGWIQSFKYWSRRVTDAQLKSYTA